MAVISTRVRCCERTYPRTRSSQVPPPPPPAVSSRRPPNHCGPCANKIFLQPRRQVQAPNSVRTMKLIYRSPVQPQARDQRFAHRVDSFLSRSPERCYKLSGLFRSIHGGIKGTGLQDWSSAAHQVPRHAGRPRNPHHEPEKTTERITVACREYAHLASHPNASRIRSCAYPDYVAPGWPIRFCGVCDDGVIANGVHGGNNARACAGDTRVEGLQRSSKSSN